MDHPPSPSSPLSTSEPSASGPPGPSAWPDGLTLPRSAFEGLSSRLRGDGPSGTAALREAGRETGAALYGLLEDGADLSPDEFWERTCRIAGLAGLGRPEYAVIAPGVGSVTLARGPESDRSGGGACHFATGWIAGLLSRAAGEPVAVLEVRCAALGPGEGCRFLVGSGVRLRRIRRRLADGTPLPGALGPGEGSPPSPERS